MAVINTNIGVAINTFHGGVSAIGAMVGGTVIGQLAGGQMAFGSSDATFHHNQIRAGVRSHFAFPLFSSLCQDMTSLKNSSTN